MPINKYKLSVIIPVYNGASSIRRLVESLFNELKEISFEVVLVNDSSPDNSAEVCKKIVHDFSNIKFVNLRKNFGEFNAVMCGLNYAEGDYCVMIDDDFQNPPSEIIKLYECAVKSDFDVVYSFYETKRHHWFRNFGSWLVNRISTSLFEKPSDLYLSSFKLIKKEVVTEIIKYSGPYPYIDALIFRVTRNVGKIQVQHNIREEGQSNYTFKKIHSLFMTILFGYSILPARIILYSGFLLLIISILFILLYILNIFQSEILCISSLLGSIQLIAMGVIAEYISKSYLTQNSHPQFTIKEILKSN